MAQGGQVHRRPRDLPFVWICSHRHAGGGREIEVLRLIAQGCANKEIAAQLGLSEPTVKTYIVRMLAKLGAPDRTRAVTMALELGYLRL
jgi:DNA-binding NarL/FixJ family response regulator